MSDKELEIASLQIQVDYAYKNYSLLRSKLKEARGEPEDKQFPIAVPIVVNRYEFEKFESLEEIEEFAHARGRVAISTLLNELEKDFKNKPLDKPIK